MKKVLFLLLVTSISYGQALFDKGIKITGGITTANDATKVVVQSANNVLNTILKSDLQDVTIVNTTAELTTGIGNINKLYATRDNTIIYRYNGTIYVPLSADISGKEDIANKQNSLATDATNLKYPTVTAVNTGLATKQNTLTNPITGTGTLNTSTRWTGTNTQGNGSFIDDGLGNVSLVGDGKSVALQNNGSANYPLRLINTTAAGFSAISVKGGPNITNAMLGLIGQRDNGEMILFNQANAPIAFSTNSVQRGQFNANGLDVTGKITATLAPTNANDVVRKTELDLKANLASPALTGTPTAPTATVGTNNTQVATTAFVLANSQSIPQLEFNATDLTVWNNGKGNVATNTSFGNGALIGNTTGGLNTSIGGGALSTNTTGSSNVAVGNSSGNVSGGTVVDNSVFIGVSATPQGNNQTNQIVIGQNTTGAGSNTATLGNTSITSTILRGTVSGGNATALNHLVTKAQTLYTNQTITANKTVTIAEFVNNNELVLRVDATAGNITVSLPTFTALQGYKVTVRKVDSSANSVLIQSVGGVNIDGASTLTVSGQYGKATIGADLVQYIIL